jgi:hypothetical protein
MQISIPFYNSSLCSSAQQSFCSTVSVLVVLSLHLYPVHDANAYMLCSMTVETPDTMHSQPHINFRSTKAKFEVKLDISRVWPLRSPPIKIVSCKMPSGEECFPRMRLMQRMHSNSTFDVLAIKQSKSCSQLCDCACLHLC